MEYTVLLQRENGHYLATVPSIPGLKRTGQTKEGVVSAVQSALDEIYLSADEWITLTVPSPASPQHNPWLETAGMFADDETLLPMMEQIYRWREEE